MLFSACNEGLEEKFFAYDQGQQFEIPIVEDYNGHTVLDIALANHDQKKIENPWELLSKAYEIFSQDKKQTIFNIH